MSRTYLDTSDGMDGYAKRNGASYDKATDSWYVTGPVPLELLGLARARRENTAAVIRGFNLPCPKCGASLRIVRNFYNHDLFYGCSQYRSHGCKGAVSLQAGDALIQKGMRDVKNKVIVFKKDFAQSEELKQILLTLSKRLINIFGCELHAKKWMTTKKIQLDLHTPIEAILMDESPARVNQILDELDD